MYIVIIASFIILTLWFFISQWLSRSGPAPGESVYLDRGFKSRVLTSHLYGIRAKPDNIETGSDEGLVLVEFKNRSRAYVYPSDEAQVIASVLAARESGYDVKRAMLEVRGGKRIEVPLNDNAQRLAKRIEKPLEAARQVALGQVPQALPARKKCGTCGFRHQCDYKA